MVEAVSHKLPHPGNEPMTSFPDLDYTEDEETDAAGSLTEKRVPPPKQLTLETHLNKSLVIGWNPPENFPVQKIDCFRVVVDGGVRSVVGANETRATVTGEHRSFQRIAFKFHINSTHPTWCASVL